MSPMPARQPSNPRYHTAHASILLTQACHPQHSCQHASHPPCKYDSYVFYASLPPLQARHQRHQRQYKQHAISKNPTNVVLFQCFQFTIIPNDGDDSKCATFVQSAQLNHDFMVRLFDFFKVVQLLQLLSLSRQNLNFQVMLVSCERMNQLND